MLSRFLLLSAIPISSRPTEHLALQSCNEFGNFCFSGFLEPSLQSSKSEQNSKVKPVTKALKENYKKLTPMLIEKLKSFLVRKAFLELYSKNSIAAFS